MNTWEAMPLPALDRMIEDVSFILSTTTSQSDTVVYKEQEKRLAEMRAAKTKKVIGEVVAEWDEILRDLRPD